MFDQMDKRFVVLVVGDEFVDLSCAFVLLFYLFIDEFNCLLSTVSKITEYCLELDWPSNVQRLSCGLITQYLVSWSFIFAIICSCLLCRHCVIPFRCTIDVEKNKCGLIFKKHACFCQSLLNFFDQRCDQSKSLRSNLCVFTKCNNCFLSGINTFIFFIITSMGASFVPSI